MACPDGLHPSGPGPTAFQDVAALPIGILIWAVGAAWVDAATIYGSGLRSGAGRVLSVPANRILATAEIWAVFLVINHGPDLTPTPAHGPLMTSLESMVAWPGRISRPLSANQNHDAAE